MAKKKSLKSSLRAKKFAANLISNGGNATQAYKELQGTQNQRVAEVEASKYLRKPEVQAEVLNLAQAAGFDAISVLTRIRQRAFFDIRKAFNPDGSIKPIHTMDDDTACMVREIKTVELFEGEGDQKHCFGHVREIKAQDAHNDLKLLGQHLRLFADVHEHQGSVVIKNAPYRPKRG